MDIKVTFADIELTQLFKVLDVKRSILPERENYSIAVSSKHGAYYTGFRYLPRQIEVEILLNNGLPLSSMRALAWMLDIDTPSKLTFSDEPDKFYYAVLDGATDIERITKYGKGVLKFVCFNPFAHSTTTKTFEPSLNGKFIINNQGTAPTQPKFNITFEQDCGYVALVSPKGMIQIGNPQELDGVALPPSDRLINDAMESTSGWTVNTSGKSRTSGAVIQGNVTTVGNPAYGIKPNSWGTQQSGWYGMTIRKNLPVSSDQTSTAEYWEASFIFNFTSGTSGATTIKELGILELNIMDESNNFLAGFSMKDTTAGYEFNVPEFYVGNTLVWQDKPSIPSPKTVQQYNSKTKKYETKTVTPTHIGKWNDFYGKVIIRKSGNQFYFELQKIVNNVVTEKATKTYYDTSNAYGNKKAKSINIWFGKYSSHPALTGFSVNDVKFRKDYVTNWKELPNLFGAGDKLIIDCEASQVYLNESLFMDVVDIGSTFFEVDEGETEIQFYHSSFAGTPRISATITEKFL